MKQVTKIGIQTLDQKMTHKQALAYGNKHMPTDLRRAGFVCSVFCADSEINGWSGFRINYSK